MSATDIYVIIPNLNGEGRLGACLQALNKQTRPHTAVVVDNGSQDGSVALARSFNNVVVLVKDTNSGFAGGVNTGINYALERGAKAIALLNNDAVADSSWLGRLVEVLGSIPEAGIVTSKIVQSSGRLDSTGDFYSSWGLAFPRGRGEPNAKDRYNQLEEVPAASGGASLYRAQVFREAGVFDEAFFAYYEDVDISLRAQRAGWRVYYQPKAVVTHEMNATANTMPAGFTAYHSLKNHQLLFTKAMPLRLLPLSFFKFYGFSLPGLAFTHYQRGVRVAVLRGLVAGWLLSLKALPARAQLEWRMVIRGRDYARLIYRRLPPRQRAKLRSGKGA